MSVEPRRILVVEDDEMHAELIRRAFEQTPTVIITVAHRLEQAVRVLEAGRPDMVIADLRLPDGRGIDLCQGTLCPIVIMTSQGSENDAVEAMRAGALDYVVKSETMFGELPHVVDRALREWTLSVAHSRATRQLRSQYDVAAALATSTVIADAAPPILESIGRCVGWPAGELWRVDEAGQCLRREAVWVASADLEPLSRKDAAGPLHRGEGVPGATWAAGELVTVSGPADHPELGRRAVVQRLGLHCAYGFPVHTSDGRTFALFTFYAHAIDTPNGDIHMLMSTVSAHLNVFAERQREAEARRQLQAELLQRERLAAVGETAATLAHEIANPLNSMYLQAQLLQRRLRKLSGIGDGITGCVDLLLSENVRLSELLQEFRSMARGSSLELQPTDVGALLREVLQLHGPVFAQGRVEPIDELPETLPKVGADRAKLKQVLLNLVKNAAEAMPDGGRLTVSAAPNAGELVLLISDTGGGLPVGVDVFEPFRTTKAMGTGLGLPVARQILSAHRGTIEADDNPGGGARFRITLPLPDPDCD